MDLINSLISTLNIQFKPSMFSGESPLPYRACTIRKEVISVDDSIQFSLSLIDNSIGEQILFSLLTDDVGDFISAVVSGQQVTSLEDFYAEAGEYLQMIINEFDGE
ncbi:hypothetical protein OCF84_20605 (plasmid) [Shewanella xiamenensis]|uniref:Uncharacterized protein n=1 Tax=Shewanella xiamenensis TaxID=332186 RepID=A0ABT6UFT1_9GAMM|nr:hypothetical protein [Shewanella xiamenensis]MDI5833329.1 hypothetical protein [Shewanella xiamenensis]WHF57919.1 hypothetical protein OCF84_20605 [Shewanella xiamenensis]